MKTTRNAQAAESVVLPWGVAKWLVTAHDGSSMSLGEVIVLPGQSHEWHNHETSEEIVYVISGTGEFTVGEGNRFKIQPGDAIHIPTAVFHDSHNTGWAPLHLLVLYSPAGPEVAEVVGPHRLAPATEPLVMRTSVEES
jgi:oxalate decarboxylase/phosphoglucose isomerase-like protein (cupin superfamily)